MFCLVFSCFGGLINLGPVTSSWLEVTHTYVVFINSCLLYGKFYDTF